MTYRLSTLTDMQRCRPRPHQSRGKGHSMRPRAVVLEARGSLDLREVALRDPKPAEAVVRTTRTGVFAGAEKLLRTGRMPMFPGMGHPLVPGCEAVGELFEAGPESGRRVGELVFVAGADCHIDVRPVRQRQRHRHRQRRQGRPARRRDGGQGDAAGARGHGAPCHRGAARAAARSDRRPWRAWPAARAAHIGRGRRPDGVGDQPHPPRRRRGVCGDRPGRRRAARSPRDLRHVGRPGLHARGAHPRRRRMEACGYGGGAAARHGRRAVSLRSDHP